MVRLTDNLQRWLPNAPWPLGAWLNVSFLIWPYISEEAREARRRGTMWDLSGG